MSRLYNAIKRMRERGDRAVIGQVLGHLGGARYRVQIGDYQYVVEAAAEATAETGQAVAVLVHGRTGSPIAMLGPVSG
jgi:hypothetical protein